MSKGILFFGLLIAVISTFAQENNPAFVWGDAEGSGRQQTVLFRRNLSLGEKDVSKATIHLFADSRYHLYINGTHVNFGPSRFYVAHPQFDSYDLTPYLRPGKNVIAVEALIEL